ncbi:MAG: HAD domain-containing protein [Candidatus Kryptoniota bacterium]
MFLDIDGVLNLTGKELTVFKIQLSPPIGRWCQVGFCMDNIESFNRLIDKIGESNTDIVISSTWRKVYSLAELREIFKQVGIKGNIVGVTPDMFVDMRTNVRADEIKRFVEKHGISTFVVIDDDEDMADEFIKQRLVITNLVDRVQGGFTDAHIPLVMEKLRNWSDSSLNQRA